ncbi:hypothetical protein GIB67_024426 [Kingdonia uniflora]|uniref:Phytochrome central region domain-containing protein n=1 Tax=Kingdonia uniflora TaxID=39325 RepID=A0A7J7P5J9_9MAGN|nr:hypothetical protein GIB67_024426 [Kingdonia uniflora]
MPTEDQIRDIASWLHQHHNGSTGLSTDSLVETGYLGTFVLGEEVCEMAAISITSKDFHFWFRSHGAKDIKWGGAKRDPKDKVVYERTQWVNDLHIVTAKIVRLIETASVPILAVDVCGQEGDKVVFGFFDKKDKYLEALLSVNERMDAKGKIIGVLGFLHMASPELQHALQVQRMSEEVVKISLKELAYVRREIRNPLQGITFN